MFRAIRGWDKLPELRFLLGVLVCQTDQPSKIFRTCFGFQVPQHCHFGEWGDWRAILCQPPSGMLPQIRQGVSRPVLAFVSASEL